MDELRDFMFERVYLGPAVRAEHAQDRRRRAGGCSSTTSSIPSCCRRRRGGRPRRRGGSWRERVTDYLAGMTDRYCIRAYTELRGAAGVRPLALPGVALYTNESKDRVRDAVDFVELVSARTELRRAGPARYEGLCPFHDERTPSFGIDPAQKVYYCFGCQASGDVFTFVQETEGVDFKGALELLAERYGVELEREQEDPREAERRRRRERLLELLDAHDRLLRALPVGVEARRRGRASTWLGGASARRSCASSASATRRARGTGCCSASRRGGFSEQELYATGLAQRSQAERPALRPLPLADHVPARRHPRARARLRRARDAATEQRPRST